MLRRCFARRYFFAPLAATFLPRFGRFIFFVGSAIIRRAEGEGR